MRQGKIPSISILIAVSGIAPARLRAQAEPTASRPRTAAVFATVGGANTQFPYYADNAVGLNLGGFIQPYPLLGVEIQGGAYPVSARFKQEPVTAGLRIGTRRSRSKDVQALMFAYFGGGASRSQDSTASYTAAPASWAPCWQISEGADVVRGKFAWRVYEVSLTETYTSRQDLKSLAFNTGLIYYFGNLNR